MKQRTIFQFLLFATLSGPSMGRAEPLIQLKNFETDNWRDTVAVAPVKTEDPVDGLRATLPYFESLADGASTPLLAFLPSSVAVTWTGEDRKAWLADLQSMDTRTRPHWLVLASIDACQSHDYADKSYWREAGWVWLGRSRLFCVPKASATLHATIEIVEIETGRIAASATFEESGQRSGPMVELTAAHEHMRCASSVSLHAKAKGQALRQMGSRLALEADWMLNGILFDRS